MKANVDSNAEQVVDARSASAVHRRRARSTPRDARGAHPRLEANLPYDRLFNDDGTWKTGDDAEVCISCRHAGVDVEKPIVATCGSGITGSTLAFGLHLLGRGCRAV